MAVAESAKARIQAALWQLHAPGQLDHFRQQWAQAVAAANQGVMQIYSMGTGDLSEQKLTLSVRNLPANTTAHKATQVASRLRSSAKVIQANTRSCRVRAASSRATATRARSPPGWSPASAAR